MQGKEASEQETKAKSNVGIDVSKDWLDIHVLPAEKRLRVANDATGIRHLKRWLLRYDVALVVIEATGKWHRQLHRSLAASAIPVALVDPFRVRMFAKAQGILAKTDQLDARVLALFAAIMNPPQRAIAPEVLQELAELVVARASAVDAEIALKNQLVSAQSKFLKRELKRRIVQAGKHVDALEREILARIKADPQLARRYDVLTSIAGIGFVTAATLIACLTELGSLNPKQIAMLAGLAPIADQSGERNGVRVVWGGRAGLRRILYLAAGSAARFNPDMKAFYVRLIAKGKPAKVALIAVARKLAILANTLINQDRIWQPHAPKYA
jgi:transposase